MELSKQRVTIIKKVSNVLDCHILPGFILCGLCGHIIFFLVPKVVFDIMICLFISRSSFYKTPLLSIYNHHFCIFGEQNDLLAIFVNNKSPFLSLTIKEFRSSEQSILFIGIFKTCSIFISFVSKYATNFVSILFHLIINPFLKFFPPSQFFIYF